MIISFSWTMNHGYTIKITVKMTGQKQNEPMPVRFAKFAKTIHKLTRSIHTKAWVPSMCTRCTIQCFFWIRLFTIIANYFTSCWTDRFLRITSPERIWITLICSVIFGLAVTIIFLTETIFEIYQCQYIQGNPDWDTVQFSWHATSSNATKFFQYRSLTNRAGKTKSE